MTGTASHSSTPVTCVLVTGATGLIGTALGRALVASGVAVRALVRDQTRAAATLPAGVTAWAWRGPGADGSAPAPLPAEALAGVDGVVNLAGASLADGRWTPARKLVLRASRIALTDALIAGLAAAGARPRVLVSMSGSGVYGDRGAEPVDESAPPGTGFLAELARDWERSAGRAAAAVGAQVVLLRTGVVLARPEQGGALPRMVLPARLGLGGAMGSGAQFLPWIDLADQVALIRFALDGNGLAGPVNAVAPEAVDNRTFAATLRRVLGRPAAPPVPAFALRLMLGREAADAMLLGGQRLTPRRAQAAGFAFRFPTLEPALRDLLDKGQP